MPEHTSPTYHAPEALRAYAVASPRRFHAAQTQPAASMTVVWGDGVGIAASKQFTVCSFVRESTMTLTATTIPFSIFPFPFSSFAHIPNIGYNRRRKQTRASASVVLFFNAVSCSFAV